MAPPVESFPTSQLAQRVQQGNLKSRGKNSTKSSQGYDLKKCELLEMVQYACKLEVEAATGIGNGNGEGEEGSSKVIRCRPVVKLFRRWDCFFFLFLGGARWGGGLMNLL